MKPKPVDPESGWVADNTTWKKLLVRGAGGRLVPLTALVAVREVEAPAAVERRNGLPMVAITANPAAGASLAQARGLCEARAEEARRGLGLSAEYRLAWRLALSAPRSGPARR